jgi:hypothetical protein
VWLRPSPIAPGYGPDWKRRSVQVRIHAPRLELHPRAMQLLVGKLGDGMIARAFVDGAIDLLPHMARQLLVARGWQALAARLFAAGAQLRFWRSRFWRSRFWRSRFWRSRLWCSARLPVQGPYCLPVEVVRKLALPTSRPLTGAPVGVSTFTCSS